MDRILGVVLLMALVTYVPRMLPMVFLGDRELPPFWDSLFYYIPFAVLGALIFPGILGATGDLSSSLAGMAAAVALAWWGRNPVIVVFGAIAAAFVLQVLS